MSDQLNVTKREKLGTRNSRRTRRAGQIPAVLYGHGLETVSLSVSRDEFWAAIRHGARLVDLKGEVNESAFIRDVQWDAFGVDVLHVDLTRIDKDEKLDVTVNVELRGVAPGISQGGAVSHQRHDIEIRCTAITIPEKLTANINNLALGDVILASDLEIPEGAELLVEPDTVIVQCIEAISEDEEAAVMELAEPEVIGRKADDEAED